MIIYFKKGGNKKEGILKNKLKEFSCAFCKGKGIDPFGIMSPLSTCQVCFGTKKVKLFEPLEECIYCRGRGIFPQRRLTCTVCMGKGLININQAYEKCPECQGKTVRNCEYLPCPRCKGKGKISKEKSLILN